MARENCGRTISVGQDLVEASTGNYLLGRLAGPVTAGESWGL